MTFNIEKDHIGIFAPSSFIEPERLEGGIKALESFGFKVKTHKQASNQLGQTQSSGTHEEKLSALYDLLQDNEVGAIMITCGGNRSLHYLDLIDYNMLDKFPKPLIGISDFTTILNAAQSQCKNQRNDILGPVLTLLYKNKETENIKLQIEQLKETLAGKKIIHPTNNAKIVKTGKAIGKTTGGTQSVFQALMGTKYFPNLTNKTLFIEDIFEETSRIDRMFAQLRLSGELSKISGLVVGEYLLPKDSGRPFGFSIEDIVKEHTKELDIPIIINAPFGHGKNLFPIPFGKEAYFEVNDKIMLEI